MWAEALGDLAESAKTTQTIVMDPTQWRHCAWVSFSDVHSLLKRMIDSLEDNFDQITSERDAAVKECGELDQRVDQLEGLLAEVYQRLFEVGELHGALILRAELAEAKCSALSSQLQIQ